MYINTNILNNKYKYSELELWKISVIAPVRGINILIYLKDRKYKDKKPEKNIPKSKHSKNRQRVRSS